MRTALLIIDMQQALFGETPEPFESAQVVTRINDLASRARLAQVPVVWVQHENADSLAYGSQGWQLLPDLATASGDLFVRKSTPDSFLRTGLVDVLASRAVDSLVVCGYASEFCVDTTVRRAAALGYPVVIASDAHTTQDKPHASAVHIREHHNATLCEITSFGPEIRALETADIHFGGRA